VWPEFAGECLILTLPGLVLFGVWKRLSRHADLDIMVRAFAAGMIPGCVVAVIVEGVVTVVFAFICFYDQADALKAQYDSAKSNPGEPIPRARQTFGFFAFIFLMSYVVAGGTEESVKYVITDQIPKRKPLFKDWIGLILYAAAAACGFSTIENVGYILMAAKMSIDAGLENSFERIFISTPLHIGTAVLIGFGIAKRHVFNVPLSKLRIMAVPVFIHGTFDYILLMIYAFQDDIDAASANIGSIVGCVLMLIVLLGFIIRERRSVRQLLQAQEVVTHADEGASASIAMV
jgi:RsiW-degrading membrane proteinase PrsW (M82 family)